MPEGHAGGPTVQRVDVAAQHTAVVRRQVPSDSVEEFIDEALGVVLDRAAARGWQITGRPVARLHRRGTAVVDVEAGYPVVEAVDPSGEVLSSRLPGGPAVTVLHVGPHRQVENAYAAAREWMHEHHLEPVGTPWECYLDGPGAARPRTAVFLPCDHELIEPRPGSQ